MVLGGRIQDRYPVVGLVRTTSGLRDSEPSGSDTFNPELRDHVAPLSSDVAVANVQPPAPQSPWQICATTTTAVPEPEMEGLSTLKAPVDMRRATCIGPHVSPSSKDGATATASASSDFGSRQRDVVCAIVE